MVLQNRVSPSQIHIACMLTDSDDSTVNTVHVQSMVPAIQGCNGTIAA